MSSIIPLFPYSKGKGEKCPNKVLIVDTLVESMDNSIARVLNISKIFIICPCMLLLVTLQKLKWCPIPIDEPKYYNKNVANPKATDLSYQPRARPN